MKKFVFIFGCLFSLATTVFAFNPILSEVAKPYDIISIESSPNIKQEYLGELKNYPIMYEMSSKEPFTIKAKVYQLFENKTEPTPFSLIAIRKNDRGGGVTEVGRHNPARADWTVVEDKVLGMTFWQGPDFSYEVEAGTYRIEISTPDNIGQYMIVFGEDEQSVGYFEMLSNIRMTQKFFGKSVFSMVVSSYVYYSLGIVLLLFALYKTWQFRKKIAYVD